MQIVTVELDREALITLTGGADDVGCSVQLAGYLSDLLNTPLTATILARFNAMTIDSPRASASANVADLARSEVNRIVMVSCNPASFARNAAILVDSDLAFN